MKPETFTRVAKLSDLSGAGPFALSADGVDIVLLKAGGSWRAFEGRCPHQGALLGEGELDGGALVCRNHRWRFSVDSGKREGGPECLASCPVAERDGGLFVDITGLKRPPDAKTTTRSLDDLPGPKGLPLVGNMHQLNPTKVHLIFEDWAARFGSTYQFRMGSTRVVVTTDPALIEDVLRARPETLRRDANMDVILSEIGIRGVFNAEGEAWRPQRKLSVAGLAQRNLRQMYPNIRTVAKRMKMRWERAAGGGGVLDVVEELKRFTVDVTMLVAFGHDANTVEQADHVIQRELEVVLPAISRRIFAIFPSWRYVQMPSDRRLTRALAKVREWLGGLLADARARLEAEPARAQKPSNFIEAMLTSLDENGTETTKLGRPLARFPSGCLADAAGPQAERFQFRRHRSWLHSFSREVSSFGDRKRPPLGGLPLFSIERPIRRRLLCSSVRRDTPHSRGPRSRAASWPMLTVQGSPQIAFERNLR